MLWGRAAGLCSMPNCRIQLVMDETETDDPTLIGEECHIVARSEKFSRGQNDLPPYKRNLYNNLILLCRNHHKLVDANPEIYNLEKLRTIKKDHEAWVRKNIESFDERRQRDDEYYTSIIDRWEKDCELDGWEAWSSWILSGGGPEMSKELDASLFEFRRWIFCRVWPGRYPSLEQAFQNFLFVLIDFQETFRKFVDEDRVAYALKTKKFYKIDKWDEELYNRLLRDYEDHIDLVADLMLELSRAANHICDEVREHLLTSYRLKEGRIVVHSSYNSDFKQHWTIPLYTKQQLESERPYLGLVTFKYERKQRDCFFAPSDDPLDLKK